ncbi:efflux RND transporter permease subunit [Shewanella eurypsychrophilus]|uniref:Efflux RND transporter permease subunit n=1 Tax=Shewanella eurypsychrophilus TaxID=2593656 RepID=A0ABX6V661_9GAMM|nr:MULTISPECIES: efflux RND transporter permease subunit [Shewanella]QFU22183.1 MMPL family transporter [Shewanella sp. YLB-09]QPG57470.1 efflux RND transporter permease subunit [Shewanella eurypsychrophilus]
MQKLTEPCQSASKTKADSILNRLISWMIDNPIAVNLLTVAIVISGLYAFGNIVQETSPSFKVDEIEISADFPGASPKEIEQSIVLPIEHSLTENTQIDRISATAIEGTATITLTLNDGVDADSVIADVKNDLDGINSFPASMEPLQISLVEELDSLVEFGLYGDLSETSLRQEATRLKNALLNQFDIAKIELEGVREPEIIIEITQDKLYQYQLTLAQITQKIAAEVTDISAGSISTNAGDILIRTLGRKDEISHFSQINILSQPDGAQITLGQIANISFGFSQQEAPFLVNGQPGVMLVIYQSKKAKPIKLSSDIQTFVTQYQASLPSGAELTVLDDQAQSFQTRTDLLLNNGLIGMILVIIALSLFLDMRLAFWVCMGIPIAIIGSLSLMPLLNIPLNMITLFAFIITLGILVDDAVIVAENIYQKIQNGADIDTALKQGASEMAVPVCFSVVTNIIAFVPLLFVPGELGVMYKPMTLLIFAIFTVSLVEALFILPYHLKQLGKPRKLGRLGLFQQQCFHAFETLRDSHFKKLLKTSLNQPWSVLAFFVSMTLITFSWVNSGRVDSGFVPKVESQRIDAEVEFPAGAALSDKKQTMALIEAAGVRAFARLNEPNSYKHIMVSIHGSSASTTFQIVEDTERDYTAREFVDTWRTEIGELAGTKSLFFDFEVGPGGGKELSIELGANDSESLKQATFELMQQLQLIEGVIDIDSGLIDAQLEYTLMVNARGSMMGFDSDSLGALVRNSFYGDEVKRQIQNSEELKIRVMRHRNEQFKVNTLGDLLIVSPSGEQVLLKQVADIKPIWSASQIDRVDGIEQVEVSASFIRSKVNVSLITTQISDSILPALMQKYPNVTAEMGGSARTERKVNSQLMTGVMLALFMVFSFLAIYFKSTLDAVLILSVIPLCLAAAMLGHIILNQSFSVMSLFGMIALSGLVLNGSFVLLLEVKQQLHRGVDIENAIINASLGRFRPVVITAMTTTLGLAPLLFETSTQAQYLIPMVISLSFGTLFSIATILVFAPALFLLSESWRFRRDSESNGLLTQQN